jgi:heptosyltransferase-2
MNIIIKTPKFIGDTIMTIPSFELLKKEYPSATFTIVCHASSVDIYRDKGIKRFIIDKGKKDRLKNSINMIKEIKEERYDLGVLFHNTFLDALIFKLSNIKTIIGYNKENRKFLLDFWLKIDRSRHYVNHYANLINQYLGNKYTILPDMKINYEKSKLLKETSKKTIGFLLGGDNKGTRSYPKELSIELFSLLKESNYHIILMGDKQDNINNTLYQEYLESINVDVTNLSGKTTVSEFIDLIASTDLLVTIDSSAMHISASTNTPFIVLKGKGTSAFDTVYPKVNFGTILFSGKDMIKDQDIIKTIKPIEIKQSIKKVLNEL